MNQEKKKKYFILVALLLSLIALSVTAQIVTVNRYNSTKHTSFGGDMSKSVHMLMSPRGDNTSRWVKTNFYVGDRPTDLIGEIYDGTLYNNSSDMLSSWTMRVDVTRSCYINQAWNGMLEIHQYVGSSNEKTQTLSLQQYTLSDIQLDYLYDGDLFIPLNSGDYFIYHPSERYKEVNLNPGENIVIGMIFYCSDTFDIGAYRVEYFFNMDYTEGIWFWIIIVLSAATLISFALYHFSAYVYKKAQKDLSMKISGISSMSELYAVIFMVSLDDDSLTVIDIDDDKKQMLPSDGGAAKALEGFIEMDSTERYRDIMLGFVNLETLAQRMEDRNNISCEFISNSYGWCRIRFIAMDRHVGEPLKKVLFTVEVIDLEKKEMDRIQLRVEKAESENRAKSAFLANMSHEIRTPINTVLGLDTMILRESREDAIRSYAKDIKKAGNMLLELINGILDFSKLESGRIELVPSEYSLKDMIDDVRCITSGKFADKDLKFSIEVDPQLPNRLYGDDVRIKQIFVNLLTNAAKYTREGNVWLKVGGRVKDDNTVALSVSVKDTGMGIKEEDIPKLAERFTRLDENRNRSIEGTGIGISLITGLLDMMNSKLEIESVYGQGSEFSFVIDQKIVDSAPVGEIVAGENSDSDDDEYTVPFKAPDTDILVVDDNEMNLMVFENLLKETEMRIDKASSGLGALELTLEKRYDIIFMDHMMPGMDGIETFKAIKVQENGQNCDTPVVILTANAVREVKEEFLRQGFCAFVAKPIQPDILEDTIMKFLPEDKYEKCSGKSEHRADRSAPIAIDGVDTSYALEHIGSKDGVLKAMKQFVTVADSESEELMKFYSLLRENPTDKNALSDYRIKVHAMKTSAALVGGLMVYGAAAQLEYAARDGNAREVLDITPYFIEFWDGLRDRLSDYFDSIEDKSEQKSEMDRDKLESILHQLMTSMNAYDVTTADNIVSELSEYGAVPEISAILKDLKTAVANLDAPRCAELVESVLK